MRGGLCTVGRRDRKGRVRLPLHAYGATVGPDPVVGVGTVVSSSPASLAANSRGRGGLKGHVTPTGPLSAQGILDD